MQNTEKWIETFIVPDPDIEQLAITEDSYPLNMALHQEDPIRLEEYGYFRWYCAGQRMVAVLFFFPAIYAVEACCPKLSRCFGIFLAAAPEFPGAWLVLFVLWASGALAMCVFWASGIWAPWLEQTEFSLRSLETAVV